MGGLIGITMADVDNVTIAIADLYAEALLEVAREKGQEQEAQTEGRRRYRRGKEGNGRKLL